MRTDIRGLVHTPTEVATSYVKYAEALQASILDDTAIRWGVGSMDASIIPMHPGDLVGIIARPGHGKSTLMAYLGQQTARALVAAGRDKECVVYVTFEQSAEEIEAFFQAGRDYTATDMAWGKVPIDTIRTGAVARIDLPIFTIGEGIERGLTVPKMTIDTVYAALESMQKEFDYRPVLILLDYIQLIPVERPTERTAQVNEAIHRAKSLARRVGCPIVVGVQARREVDSRDPERQIPNAADCQWASAIEQTCDKLLAIWRPVLTIDPDETKPIEINGREYSVTQQLLIAKLLKQRFDQAGHKFALHFDPANVRLADIETRDVNL